MATLYAWAVPAWFSNSLLDHTWVTDFDNQTHHYTDEKQVAAAGFNYWFCWGGYHAKGGIPGNPTGALGKQSGSRTLAKCLVRPNLETKPNPPAQGTIYTYGLDGVCHQLANQVLYATRSGSTRPLTVKRARGYALSTFLYGTYGAQQTAWRAKLQGCGAVAPRLIRHSGGTGTQHMIDLPDDFEEIASAVLADNPEQLRALLQLRTEVQTYMSIRVPGFEPPGVTALNARNQHFIDQAALLLGDEAFRRLFGIEPGQTANLIDPEMSDKP